MSIMFFKNTGMFYIPALCLLALYACWGDADLSQDKFVPFEGESLYSSPQLAEDVGIKVTASVYPSEIYYGDMAYLLVSEENLTDHELKSLPGPRSLQPTPFRVEITSPEISSKYEWYEEADTSLVCEYVYQCENLKAGGVIMGDRQTIEFPPLDDWNAPFWKEMRQKTTPEGIECVLTVRYGYSLPEDSRKEDTFSTTILVKARPEGEMELLEKWFSSTPETLFPQGEIQHFCKMPRGLSLKSSGKSDINIGFNSYDPWLFIRTGNRKPSDPNNPTTLAGWRHLEKSLEPSTLRDEVRFTRLQLEYYSASSQAKKAETRKELVDWLHSLPQAQRVSMVSSLKSKENQFRNTKLQKGYFELINALD